MSLLTVTSPITESHSSSATRTDVFIEFSPKHSSYKTFVRFNQIPNILSQYELDETDRILLASFAIDAARLLTDREYRKDVTDKVHLYASQWRKKHPLKADFYHWDAVMGLGDMLYNNSISLFLRLFLAQEPKVVVLLQTSYIGYNSSFDGHIATLINEYNIHQLSRVSEAYMPPHLYNIRNSFSLRGQQEAMEKDKSVTFTMLTVLCHNMNAVHKYLNKEHTAEHLLIGLYEYCFIPGHMEIFELFLAKIGEEAIEYSDFIYESRQNDENGDETNFARTLCKYRRLGMIRRFLEKNVFGDSASDFYSDVIHETIKLKDETLGLELVKLGREHDILDRNMILHLLKDKKVRKLVTLFSSLVEMLNV